jgi:hypothetical protein
VTVEQTIKTTCVIKSPDDYGEAMKLMAKFGISESFVKAQAARLMERKRSSM